MPSCSTATFAAVESRAIVSALPWTAVDLRRIDRRRRPRGRCTPAVESSRSIGAAPPGTVLSTRRPARGARQTIARQTPVATTPTRPPPRGPPAPRASPEQSRARSIDCRARRRLRHDPLTRRWSDIERSVRDLVPGNEEIPQFRMALLGNFHDRARPRVLPAPRDVGRSPPTRPANREAAAAATPNVRPSAIASRRARRIAAHDVDGSPVRQATRTSSSCGRDRVCRSWRAGPRSPAPAARARATHNPRRSSRSTRSIRGAVTGAGGRRPRLKLRVRNRQHFRLPQIGRSAERVDHRAQQQRCDETGRRRPH